MNPETREEQNFQVTEMRAQIWDGQTVSVARAIRKGQGGAPYLVVFNHSTNQTFFSDSQLRLVYMKRPLGVGSVLYIFFFLIWNVVGLVLLCTWSLMLSSRVRRFKRSGVTPLLGTLNTAAQRQSHLTGPTKDLALNPSVTQQQPPVALATEAPPGWYAVNGNPHKQAWWDGHAWTNNMQWMGSAWVGVPPPPSD